MSFFDCPDVNTARRMMLARSGAVLSGAAVIAAVLGIVNARTSEVRRFRGMPDAIIATSATAPAEPGS